MAVHFKKLGTRALSALVFVIVLLSGILFNYYTFTLLFLAIAIKGLLEFYNAGSNMGIKPARGPGLILGLLTYLAFVNTNYIFGDSFYNTNLLMAALIAFPFII